MTPRVPQTDPRSHLMTLGASDSRVRAGGRGHMIIILYMSIYGYEKPGRGAWPHDAREYEKPGRGAWPGQRKRGSCMHRASLWYIRSRVPRDSESGGQV